MNSEKVDFFKNMDFKKLTTDDILSFLNNLDLIKLLSDKKYNYFNSFMTNYLVINETRYFDNRVIDKIIELGGNVNVLDNILLRISIECLSENGIRLFYKHNKEKNINFGKIFNYLQPLEYAISELHFESIKILILNSYCSITSIDRMMVYNCYVKEIRDWLIPYVFNCIDVQPKYKNEKNKNEIFFFLCEAGHQNIFNHSRLNKCEIIFCPEFHVSNDVYYCPNN